MTRYDLIFSLTYLSFLTILYTYINNNNSVVFYRELLKAVETPYLHSMFVVNFSAKI